MVAVSKTYKFIAVKVSCTCRNRSSRLSYLLSCG